MHPGWGRWGGVGFSHGQKGRREDPDNSSSQRSEASARPDADALTPPLSRDTWQAHTLSPPPYISCVTQDKKTRQIIFDVLLLNSSAPLVVGTKGFYRSERQLKLQDEVLIV